MDIFDKIGEKIGQTTQVVKLNNQIAEEESKIANYYQQIGKIIFQKTAHNPEEILAEPVAMIKSAMAKIEALTAQVKQVKGVVTCEGCGAEVPQGNAFCNGCGAKVAQANTPSTPHCTGCGNVVAEGMAFCSHCGQKV